MHRALRMADAVAIYRSSNNTTITLTRVSAHPEYVASISVSAPMSTIGRKDFVHNAADGQHISRQWLAIEHRESLWTMSPYQPGQLVFEIERNGAAVSDRPVTLQSGDELVFPTKTDCDREHATQPDARCTVRALQYGTPVRYRVDIPAASRDAAGPSTASGVEEEDFEEEEEEARETKPRRPLQTCEYCNKSFRNVKQHQRSCWQRFSRSNELTGWSKKPRDAKKERDAARRNPRGRRQCRPSEPCFFEDDDDDWMDKDVPTVGDPIRLTTRM